MTNVRQRSSLNVGLDVSDRKVYACFLGPDGEIEEEARVSATPEALRCRFSHLELHRVILEVGLHSPG